MRNVEQAIASAIIILANVHDRFQPMSNEQRAIFEAVRILQKIDCHADSVIPEMVLQTRRA